jgi:mannose/fructose/N-acetylgalactosamine-specific phosphotransferase system component IID
MFCKYKNALGKPKQGLHKYRIFNIAIVDVLLTIACAYIFYLFNPKFNFFVILLCLFVLGIILHRLFCVRTTVDKLLFPKA